MTGVPSGLRRLGAAAVLTAAASGGAWVAAPALPAHAAACAQGSVSVVVDGAALGTGVRTGCANADPATGIEALRAAGFTPTRAAQQPGYFVCRIDGQPASDPCQRASPADAYWSSWTAEPGGSWTFATRGAADRDPAPGTVEGWAFGAGDPPSVPPPAQEPRAAAPASPAASPAPAPAPAPARTTSAPAPRASAPSPAATATDGTAAPTPAPPTDAPAADPTAGPTDAPTADPTAGPTSGPTSDPTAGPLTSTSTQDDGGVPVGAIAGVLLVAVLAGAAGRQALLRRRGPTTP